MSVSIPNITLLNVLAELIDAGNLLETVALRLFQSDTFFGPNTVWADLVQADFTGYAAAAAIVWNAPFVDALGNVLVETACHQFIQSDVTVTNVVYGWALTTGTTPIVLRAAERFAVPVSFDAIGRAIQTSGRFPLAAGAG